MTAWTSGQKARTLIGLQREPFAKASGLDWMKSTPFQRPASPHWLQAQLSGKPGAYMAVIRVEF